MNDPAPSVPASPSLGTVPLGLLSEAPDVASTQLLHLTPAPQTGAPVVLWLSRDPGNANTLLPVIKRAVDAGDIDAWILINGTALGMIGEAFPCATRAGSGHPNALFSRIRHPKVIVTAGAWSDQTLELLALAKWPQAKLVVVENAYCMCNGLLETLRARRIRQRPAAACVIDAVSAGLMRKFLGIEDRSGEAVRVTGQPAYDHLAAEQTAQRRAEVRHRLGFGPDRKLVVWMTIRGEHELLHAAAIEMVRCPRFFELAISRHRRDDYQGDYEEACRNAGLRVMESMGFTRDELGLAADAVITTYSMDGMVALCRDQQVLFVSDDGGGDLFVAEPGTVFPYPPTTLGAAIDVPDVRMLPEFLAEALDPACHATVQRRRAAGRNYRPDGMAAKRVLDVIVGLALG